MILSNKLIHHCVGDGDGDIMLIFFPGFQLATGKRGNSYMVSIELDANLLQDDFRQSLVV